MTEAERIARAHRASDALDLITPMFDALDEEWTSRMVEIANTELSRDKRADRITALSHALKISKTIRSGLMEAIRDGEVARGEKLRAEKIEQMTAPQRRLLSISPF